MTRQPHHPDSSGEAGPDRQEREAGASEGVRSPRQVSGPRAACRPALSGEGCSPPCTPSAPAERPRVPRPVGVQLLRAAAQLADEIKGALCIVLAFSMR